MGDRKVLVTGGLGYVGSHCVIELSRAGFDVAILDNLSASSEERLHVLEDMLNRKLDFFKSDVRDRGALVHSLRCSKATDVLHAAGVKSVPESALNPTYYWDVNVLGTLQVLEGMLESNITSLVFSSSATVYSDISAMPVSESSITGDCKSPYGWTKFAAEKLCEQFAIANSGFKVTNLRYFNPVGADKCGRIRECEPLSGTNLFPAILDVVAGHRSALEVYGSDYSTPDGYCIRDFVHVSDLAAAHVAAFASPKARGGFDIYNIGTGKGLSVMEVLVSFQKHLGAEVPYVLCPRRTGDLEVSFADVANANAELDWNAVRSVDDMVVDALRSIGILN